MVDPQAGRGYQYPVDGAPSTGDGFAGDPGFTAPENPDGAEAGPLRLTPEAETWIDQNVLDQGYLIDWGTREIFDPETGEVKGTVPTSFPRMI